MNVRAYFAGDPRKRPIELLITWSHALVMRCAKPRFYSHFSQKLRARCIHGGYPKSGHRNVSSHAVNVVCMLWLALLPTLAQAEELRIQETAWNGLSELRTIGTAYVAAQYAPRVDVEKLPETDALLIIHPVHPLPVDELAQFMRRGGRVAIADDFGTGQRFLETFGMGVHAPRTKPAHVLRHNERLPIASPLIGHTLTDGVTALATNHPQVLYHQALTPVFGLGGEDSAVVLSGAVGGGRLIAISDASVFINNMLQFPGNRAFARNLLRFLRGPHEAHGGQVWITDSQTSWVMPSRTLSSRLSALLNALDRLSQRKPPKLAVSLFSSALTAILLSMLASSLPKHSAYARRAYLQSAELFAGLSGRVQQYAGGVRNLMPPLLALRREIELRAAEQSRPRGTQSQPALPAEVLQELRDRGRDALANDLVTFMAAVDRVQAQGGPVSTRHFSELVATGRRILASFDAPPQHHERHE